MEPALARIQFGFFVVALVIFLLVALHPKTWVQLVGRGRVVPSSTTLVIFRTLAVICVLGTVYRLLFLFRLYIYNH